MQWWLHWLRLNGSRTARWCQCFTRNGMAVGCSWSTNVIVNSGQLQTIDGSMLLLDKLCLVPRVAKYIFVVLSSSPYNSAYWTVGSKSAPQKVIMHALLEINGFHVPHLTKSPSAFWEMFKTWLIICLFMLASQTGFRMFQGCSQHPLRYKRAHLGVVKWSKKIPPFWLSLTKKDCSNPD